MLHTIHTILSHLYYDTHIDVLFIIPWNVCNKYIKQDKLNHCPTCNIPVNLLKYNCLDVEKFAV